MKIAFVNDTFLQGRGADTVIYELAKRLGKKHEVYVIASESDINEENFKVLRIKNRKFFTGNTLKDSLMYAVTIRKFRKEILRLQQKYGFDIFNVHHSSLSPALNGFPTVVTWHGTPPSENKIRTIFNRNILRNLRKNRFSVTISNHMKDALSNLISPRKIKVIPNGVSKEFKPVNKDEDYMLYVGRLESHKNVNELIKLSKDLNFPLKIVGSGPIESKLKAYSKKINADKVKFLGKISRKKLVKEYQQCSFFVSASKWEGFGLIFIEAASCGKPCIGYNLTAIKEVINNGKTGFLVDNYNGFRDAAEILIKDGKLRKSMGKEALKFSKKFDWEKTAEKYEKTFKEAIN